MTAFDPDRAAEALCELRRRRVRLDKLDPDIAPRNEAEGAAVQRALARLTGDDPPAGFKIGATARRMQDYLGLAGPAAGYMPAHGIHRSGANLDIAGFAVPGVECELAVRLGRDLPPEPCSAEMAEEAVDEVFAAIELVENRYGELAALGTPTLIADQVFHAAAVLGAPRQDGWRELDLARLGGAICVDGEARGEGHGADLLGHPMNSLAWLAGSVLAAEFGGLRARQVILLGSVTPPIWLGGPCTVTVEFTSLSPVSVSFGAG
jgi:2-keto-4-pentenoate hydratase